MTRGINIRVIEGVSKKGRKRLSMYVWDLVVADIHRRVLLISSSPLSIQ